MALLRKNAFFEALSSNKLIKLLRVIKTLHPSKGQYLYREGQEVDGLYLIAQGSLRYQKDAEFTVPVECKTNDKWMRAHVKQSGLNRKKGKKDIAIFEGNEVVGFEELFREIVVMKHHERQNASQKDGGVPLTTYDP